MDQETILLLDYLRYQCEEDKNNLLVKNGNKKVNKKVNKLNNNTTDCDVICCPTDDSFTDIYTQSFNTSQLKSFLKERRQKVSGNKNELLTNLYFYLKHSYYSTKIQKIGRTYITKQYFKLHGPAYKNRSLCTNETDFYTMEPLSELSCHQFISYKDSDNFIYGFDILSLYNLIQKNKSATNPYNRNIIPTQMVQTMKRIVQLGKLLKIHIDLKIEKDVLHNSINNNNVGFRVSELFQNIDLLGHYTCASWFNNLNKRQLITMIIFLKDIFNYRLGLMNEIKQNICPPHGEPFRGISNIEMNMESDLTIVQHSVLTILEKFVNSGIDVESRELGSKYVLGALTLVSEEASIAMPYLYDSFAIY